jgi:hypothetical protein
MVLIVANCAIHDLCRIVRLLIRCRHNVRSAYGICSVTTFVIVTVILRSLSEIKHKTVSYDVLLKRDRLRDGGKWLPRENSTEPQFIRWNKDIQSMCDGRINVYGRSFARFRDVIIYRQLINARRVGGERLSDVMNQDVDAEFYQLKPGCFRLDGCANHSVSNKIIEFEKYSYLNSWMMSTVMTAKSPADGTDDIRSTTTVFVARDEYANLYHTASDWYNVFLMMKFFNIESDCHVLFVDAHPSGPLDDVWNTLFDGYTSRLSQFSPNSRILFKDLIWATPGHRGLFEQHFRYRLPLIEEFRRLV